MIRGKLFILLLPMLLTVQFCFAQNRVLKVGYIQKMKIPQSLESIENITLRKLAMKKIQEQTQTFYMLNGKSYYVFTSNNMPKDGSTLLLSNASSIYINKETNQFVSIKRIADKTFTVEDTLRCYVWKICYNETKEILGKHCTKAVVKDGDAVVEAWFCDEIPAQVGPAGYNGLPGLVLALDTPTFSYDVLSIETMTNNIDIKVSEKKRISLSEFNKVKEKKKAEIGLSGKSNGGNIIVIK